MRAPGKKGGYVIRADGGARIGAGHLMRCLTIAEALARETDRDDILFLCADEPSARLVQARGFAVRVLGTDGQRLEQELPLWEKLEIKTDVILIDSYAVTPAYLSALRTFGATVLLDDLQREPFPVDAVVNYHIYAEEAVYRKWYRDKNIRCYLGADYVPLRPQFAEGTYNVRDTVEHVLITAGGGDADNIAAAILDQLQSEIGSKLNYHLIIGRFNPHYAEWQQRAARTPELHLYHDVEDMAGLMRQCDLAVTAGGTTVYELASVGVPFLCFSCAENQEQLARCVGEKQIAGYAGAYHLDAPGTLAAVRRLAGQLCGDRELRERFCLRGRRMVDGQGARRIAERLIELREMKESSHG